MNCSKVEGIKINGEQTPVFSGGSRNYAALSSKSSTIGYLWKYWTITSIEHA